VSCPSSHHRPRPRSLRRSPASLAPSLFVRRPSPLGALLTPSWPLGHTCCGASGLSQPSQGTHEHARCWWCSWAAARHRLPPRWPDSTSPSFSPYVVYICFKCFRRFICTLQLFHLDIAKVD
jgi:hypothetical protein